MDRMPSRDELPTRPYVKPIDDPANAEPLLRASLKRPCTCASDGNAARCPHHTQADYDAAERRCPCCGGLLNGQPGSLCGPCVGMGCERDPIGKGSYQEGQP